MVLRYILAYLVNDMAVCFTNKEKLSFISTRILFLIYYKNNNI